MGCSEKIGDMYRTFRHEKSLSWDPNYAAKGLYCDWLFVELNDPITIECFKKSRDQRRKEILDTLTQAEKERFFGKDWKKYDI
ncbi:MAG: hypothetical protein M0Z77_08750 [Thermoplasmatales archaeon]|nr:hypothetical protein [Thermoplasmatales archaeon]